MTNWMSRRGNWSRRMKFACRFGFAIVEERQPITRGIAVPSALMENSLRAVNGIDARGVEQRRLFTIKTAD
jgi:hypothetical protein